MKRNQPKVERVEMNEIATKASRVAESRTACLIDESLRIARNNNQDPFRTLAVSAYLQGVQDALTPPSEPSGNTGELPVCPVCFDAATYQTPDGRYWCSRAHWWRHIECDECQGMRVRVYPGTLLGEVETCRKCNGKATAAPCPDFSAAQSAPDETTGCADDAIPGAVVDAVREHLAAQPATEQPRIWRWMGKTVAGGVATSDEIQVRKAARLYGARIQYSTDNGKTWIDEQAEKPGKVQAE